MDIIEGNYSITYDKDLGTQLFLGGSSQRDLFVAEDFPRSLYVVIYKEQILHRGERSY